MILPPLNKLPDNTVGLGLRREILHSLKTFPGKPVDFLEIAPENWISIGGSRQAYLDNFSEEYSIVCHGLSLSLGSSAPLDKQLLFHIKAFLTRYQVVLYSEHLSFCSDEKGMFYHLLPLPFTEEMVGYVASRIRQVQDTLERRIAIENISYYARHAQTIYTLSEIDFILAVLEMADCDLLLDINNLYVNSINHQYDAHTFLDKIPKEKIAYLHIAGHENSPSEKMLIDTHGEAIDNTVWKLLEKSYQLFGVKPTVLERDNNLPPFKELLKEIDVIKSFQHKSYISPPLFKGAHFIYATMPKNDEFHVKTLRNPRHQHLYQKLIFNTLAEILEGAFPLCYEKCKQLADNTWENLIKNFIFSYPLATPYFHEIPQLFVLWLFEQKYPLSEQAHYEWVGIALAFDTTMPDSLQVNRKGDVLSYIPIVSPLAWLLHYPALALDYPHVIAWRDRQYHIHYLTLNIFSARLFSLLKDNTCLSGQKILEKIAEENHTVSPTIILEKGAVLLNQWQNNDIILGVSH